MFSGHDLESPQLGAVDRSSEGAKQWVTKPTELSSRGLADSLIVCCDELRGLPESIRAAWPDATGQTGVAHMFRI